MLRIVVDTREARSEVVARLRGLGVAVTLSDLPAADYHLSVRVGVERKTAADFTASIVDRRLFQQVEKLTETYEAPIILLEGLDVDQPGRLHPNALRGAISYLVVLKGIGLVYAKDPEDSASLLATMARHEQQGLGYEVPLRRKKKALTAETERLRVFESLPGVGPKTAKVLLHHFRTPQRLANASLEELTSIPGIGQNRAKSILAALRAPASEAR